MPIKPENRAKYPKNWDAIRVRILAREPVPCVVLDPFSGAGTTAIVASVLGRRGIGVELKADYIDIAVRRAETGRERIVNRVIGKPVRPGKPAPKPKAPISEPVLFEEVPDAA